MNSIKPEMTDIVSCYKLALASTFGLALVFSSAPAAASSGSKRITSAAIYAYCVSKISSGQVTAWQCRELANFADPVSAGMNSFHYELNYNTSLYTFNPDKSGLVGYFTVGGDLGPESGFGTQQLQLAPTPLFNFGAPLPGSTFVYTDVGGLVTVDATFASPVYTVGDVNLLVLNFKLIKPVTIDITKSFVTYHPSSPGSDFTAGAFSCSTADGGSSCGSDTPSQGVSIAFGTVPEPASWALMVVGFGAIGATLRRRTFDSAAAF